MKAQSRQSPVRPTKHYLLSPVMGTCHQHIRAQASWLWDASSSFQNGSTNVATTRIVSKSWRTLESRSQRRVTFIVVRRPYDKRHMSCWTLTAYLNMASLASLCRWGRPGTKSASKQPRVTQVVPDGEGIIPSSWFQSCYPPYMTY